ncbi:septal ring lytic transglycosylase RlpA family protein [Salinicola aestuarinus]|uniref:septal ring lytic transglycosylase RlpA family protein n=1 Tax=Salinicola aestuarinus TaxID=1949082 RepID=UPI000DA12E90|nr:septal ring lytic transglycosylase RlpA family protein [Salinicola aestuarinus]
MRGVLVLMLLVALAGCAGGGGGGRYAQTHDAYPQSPQDVANVPDAVPRVEPRSRGGNRSTYTVWGKTYHVLSDPTGYEAVGQASWYGTKFQGYDTANGESYDMYKMSAAHRTLPLPSYARVTNLDNDRTVIVRINDRGPFHEDRLIDLSYAAAARLDILKGGTGRVKVEAIDPVAWSKEHGDGDKPDPAVAASAASTPPQVDAGKLDPVIERPSRAVSPGAPTSRSSGQRYLQVAALGSPDKARALKSRLQGLLSRPVRIDNAASLYRVQVGPVDDIASLQAIRATLRDAGFAQTFVVAPAQ